MSLDVYLTVDVPGEPRPPDERIFVREGGANVELTREEWDERYPDREPAVLMDPGDEEGREVFSANITHNLGQMAGEVDLYGPLWRPEEHGITKAWQLIGPIRGGLRRMRGERDRLQEFNPANGWGNYDNLLSFIENYLAACEEHPDANVRASR